ncbi:hypothetical protein [Lihuaxuella thermophila]|uniref:Uncharacterized protein n=1 Tax=Lihuaxuella thermophila TaxID=1173111 RepID=A0A1H8IFE1_9BACL|nr:hypothetical protein [Lihuaxuella thermophila]SEN66727.1 hypothetical protein SAMN05444955_11744 [Lihuaxuella thermophila]
MEFEKFQQALYESQPQDWIYSSHLRKFIYAPDISITVEEDPTARKELSRVHHPWLEAFQESAWETRFLFLYRGIAIEELKCYQVGDVYLPTPHPQFSGKIALPDYWIARNLNRGSEKLDDYLSKAGFEVDE